MYSDKKTILVTGASRGIGRAIALALAAPDTNLVINCVKNKDALNDVKRQIEDKGACCAAFIGDVSDYDTCAQLFDYARQCFGSINVLINNAGISIVGLFQDMTRNEWERIMNVNIGSVYNCCHFAVHDMLHNHSGKIINISSVWGSAGASCEVAYSASKGAIHSFTKALAKELAPSNIQVNAIACGAIDTDMNSFLDEEGKQMLLDEIPTGRMGRPDEVGQLVSQILTGPDYLTGQIITLDGAWI